MCSVVKGFKHLIKYGVIELNMPVLSARKPVKILAQHDAEMNGCFLVFVKYYESLNEFDIVKNFNEPGRFFSS